MPERWHFTRVEEPLVRALSTASVAGVFVVGPDGSGKSTAVRAALAESRTPATWIGAPAPLRNIPFGSLAGLVRVGAATDTPAALWNVLDGVRAAVPAGNTVVVDDCHHLDPASAIVAQQLLAQRHLRVVMIAPSVATLPAVLRPFVTDPFFTRIDVDPLSPGEAADVLTSLHGHQIAAASAERLHALSEGNLLLLTMMSTAASRRGAWQPISGTGAVQLTGAIPPLEDVFAARREALRDLDPDAARLVGYLALAGSLDAEECVALGCRSDASTLLERGLVVVQQPAGTMRVATPVLGQAVLAGVDPWRARSLRGDIVRMRRSRALDPSEELALAVLSMNSDEQLPVSRLLASVETGLRLGAVDTAIDLARHADSIAPGPATVLALASSLSWRGDCDEAAAVYDRLAGAELPAPLPDVWAVMRAANIFWGLRDAPGAHTALAAADPRLPLAAGAGAAFAAFEGRLSEASAQAVPICAPSRAPSRADPAATLWAAVALSIASAYRMDRTQQSLAWDVGLAAADATSSGYQRWSFYHDAVWLALMSGGLEEARELARTASELAAGEPTATALSGTLRGLVLFEDGDLATARAVAAEAHATLRTRAPAGWTMLAALLRSRTDAQCGSVETASEALAEAEQIYAPALGVYRPLLSSATGWVRWATGDHTGAAKCFERAATIAAGQGSAVFLVEAELSAWRTLGVPPSRSLAVSSLSRAIVECVRGGPESAVAAVRAVSESGYALLAAEMAASLPRHVGGLRSLVAGQLFTPPQPATLNQRLTPEVISPREREVVLAVRQGLSNAEIAARFQLSVRTVEGHILRACDKLGVRGRKGLRDLTHI